MELTNKYEINNIVYFMHKNEIWGGKVYRYRFTVDSLWYMNTDNYRGKATELEINIEYQLCTNQYEKTGSKWIPENKLFKTIEDIIKYVMENVKF
jgi:hypothetical protein